MTDEKHLLTGREWKAVLDYDAWVEENLGRRHPNLLRIFVVAGVAAMVIISAVAIWRSTRPGAGESAGENNPAATTQQEKVRKGKRVRLVYRIDNPYGLQETQAVIQHRLDAIHLKGFTITPDSDEKTLTVMLPAMPPLEIDRCRKYILQPVRIFFAIEATPEELQHASGLGPEFSPEVFLARRDLRVKQDIHDHPDLFDRHRYTGEATPLYKNPSDWTQPAAVDDRPLFHFYPPNRWFEKDNQKWHGPATGAIVHINADKVISGSSFESLYPQAGQFGAALGFKLKSDRKKQFHALTKQNRNRKMAIIYNDRLVTRPILKGALPGAGVIEGMSEEDILRLLIAYKTSLKTKPTLIKMETLK